MDIRILGISGSPRKRRNTEFLLKVALEGAKELGHTETLTGDVETEMVSLAENKVGLCIACMGCAKLKDDSKGYCVGVKDDMNSIVDKMFAADAIILGSPVYVGDVTGQMKAFMDRCECISPTPKRRNAMNVLRNKVGGAVIQGTLRHGGQEGSWSTMQRFFIFHNMIPASSNEGHIAAGPFGGMGVGFPHGFAISKGNALEKDELGIESCRALGRRVALMTKMVKQYSVSEREEALDYHEKYVDFHEYKIPDSKK
jgi:multimeric flavodoxin WrbA